MRIQLLIGTRKGGFIATTDGSRQQWALAGFQGLPQAGAYANVMRMAMTVDTLDPAGVYVGTQGGQILASRDAGDRWDVIFPWLPPVYALETVVS